MNLRIPNTALLIVLAMAAPMSCAGPAGKRCYDSAASYLKATYGADYKNDENLIVRQRRYGKQTFTEMRDVTPGTNIRRVLFRKDAKRGLCMVMHSEAVVTLDVTKIDRRGVPLEMVGESQAPGTEPGTSFTYTLTRQGTYEPTRCREVRYDGTRRAETDIPCSKVVAEWD